MRFLAKKMLCISRPQAMMVPEVSEQTGALGSLFKGVIPSFPACQHPGFTQKNPIFPAKSKKGGRPRSSFASSGSEPRKMILSSRFCASGTSLKLVITGGGCTSKGARVFRKNKNTTSSPPDSKIIRCVSGLSDRLKNCKYFRCLDHLRTYFRG